MWNKFYNLYVYLFVCVYIYILTMIPLNIYIDRYTHTYILTDINMIQNLRSEKGYMA